jgi:hypothetical protein
MVWLFSYFGKSSGYAPLVPRDTLESLSPFLSFALYAFHLLIMYSITLMLQLYCIVIVFILEVFRVLIMRLYLVFVLVVLPESMFLLFIFTCRIYTISRESKLNSL